MHCACRFLPLGETLCQGAVMCTLNMRYRVALLHEELRRCRIATAGALAGGAGGEALVHGAQARRLEDLGLEHEDGGHVDEGVLLGLASVLLLDLLQAGGKVQGGGSSVARAPSRYRALDTSSVPHPSSQAVCLPACLAAPPASRHGTRAPVACPSWWRGSRARAGRRRPRMRRRCPRAAGSPAPLAGKRGRCAAARTVSPASAPPARSRHQSPARPAAPREAGLPRHGGGSGGGGGSAAAWLGLASLSLLLVSSRYCCIRCCCCWGRPAGGVRRTAGKPSARAAPSL